jgi:succinate-semialdehyde dehydrogenase / glutarate-semialdehyde dehydrogenase
MTSDAVASPPAGAARDGADPDAVPGEGADLEVAPGKGADPGAVPGPYRLAARLAGGLLARVVADGSAGTVTVTAPFTGLQLTDVPLSTPGDVDVAATRARAAQAPWAAMPVADRAAVLLRFHDRVLHRQDEILDLIQLECGKARLSAVEEMADVVQLARHYGRRAGRYLATRRIPALVPVLATTEVVRHPLGLVGVVAPFNYPFTLSVGEALPALVAGNAVLLKPDTRTVLSALWGVVQLEAAGLPPGLVQVVVGDAEVGQLVVDAVDHVLFTGSTATGREVAARAGRRLIGATLELGGKNPLYVADDVDVEIAAEGAVRACFAGTGQLCVSAERLYVHERVADEFVAAFVRRTRALRLGPALDFAVDVGSLTTSAQLATVARHVADAVDRGATVLAGGRPRPDLGPLFYEPTVLTGVPADAVVAREETFGPVVVVHRVRSDDEAVAAMNDTAYGLNASVWTRSTARGRALAGRVESGTVNVNDGYATAWAAVGAPQGGVKDSGVGARHGDASIAAVTREQTVAVQRATFLPAWTGRVGAPGLGPGRLYSGPGEQSARLLTILLRTMKAIGRA